MKPTSIAIWTLVILILAGGAPTCSANGKFEDIAELRKEDLSRVIKLYEKGVEKEAIETYEEALKEDETLPVSAYIYLGSYYTGKRRNDEASFAYKKAVYLEKRDFQSNHDVSKIYKLLGKNENVVESLKKELDRFFDKSITGIKFDKVLCDILVSIYLFDVKNDDAIAVYVKAIKLLPTDMYFYEKLGALYVSLKRYYEGILLFNEALKVCGDDRKAGFYNLLGNCYYCKEEYGKANNEYVVALGRKPNDSEYSFNLGRAMVANHYYAMGAHYLETAKDNGKEDMEIYYYLGKAYKEDLNYAKAKIALDKARELGKDLNIKKEIAEMLNAIEKK